MKKITPFGKEFRDHTAFELSYLVEHLRVAVNELIDVVEKQQKAIEHLTRRDE